MTATELEQSFGMAGVLEFRETDSGLIYLDVTTEAATARLYLQGAHLTEWQPKGETPVLFVSGRSAFARGKAIRGGVPVIWPWFGERRDAAAGAQPSPAHGFARTSEWTLAFAALAGDEVHLTLTLGPNEASRALGFDGFRVAYQLMIGRTLRMWLTVVNDGPQPLVFEEALHSYFAVGDVRQAAVTGLEGARYLDKLEANAERREGAGALVLTDRTDRLYVGTEAECAIEDALAARRIRVGKTGSATTVVWNPWAELTATMGDMEPHGWERMLCVESANAGADRIELAAGEAHTMAVEVAVERAGEC